MAMIKTWRGIIGTLVIGLVLGAAGMLSSAEFNRYTATEAFCTSCHEMGSMADNAVFRQSAHKNNVHGFSATCGDCHLPKGNWFIETYAHATTGVRDLTASLTHDYSDPAKWEPRRIELANEVREDMRATDSAACRNCHDIQKVTPPNQAGQAAHVLARSGRMTCIDCHFNLVHAPVPPSIEFIRGNGLLAKSARQ